MEVVLMNFDISLLMIEIVTSGVSGAHFFYNNPFERFQSKVLPLRTAGFVFGFEVSQDIGVFL